nr:MAG TPA: hypothetical protein [Caudoviricetes sp.]
MTLKSSGAIRGRSAKTVHKQKRLLCHSPKDE